MSGILGYKVFEPDFTCRGFKYEIGQTYETNEPIRPCQWGFHFCINLSDCFNYYSFDHKNKIAVVTALGEVQYERNKAVTNKIKIEKEISWHEVLDLLNKGENNTGYNNEGNDNTGNHNIGDKNTGNNNEGNYNTGWYNLGNKNTGNSNIGDENTGSCNKGYINTGNGNVGYGNTGFNNKGNDNTGSLNLGNGNVGWENKGNENVGDFNIGDRNLGDFNLGDDHFGCFNTQPHTLFFFDKPSDWTLENWKNSEVYQIMLNLIDSQNESILQTFENLTQKEKELIYNLPNFDFNKFITILQKFKKIKGEKNEN